LLLLKQTPKQNHILPVLPAVVIFQAHFLFELDFPKMLRRSIHILRDPKLQSLSIHNADLRIGNPEAKKTDVTIRKQAYGVPFKIDDRRALECALRFHTAGPFAVSSASEIVNVKRLLVPFWFGTSAVHGQYRAQVRTTSSMSLTDQSDVYKTPKFDFYYPLGDHDRLNQVLGTASLPDVEIETALCGDHIPSMLLSRYELLEHCQKMKTPPTLVPFDFSVKAGVEVIASRLTRALVVKLAQKELRKFYGDYDYAKVGIVGWGREVVSISPVFLPVYVFDVQYRGKKYPLYVCGVTGKASAPTMLYNFHKMSVAVGMTVGFLCGSATYNPLVGAATGAAALGATFVAAQTRIAAKAASEELRVNSRITQGKHFPGWMWTVEEEEKWEYEHREELRHRMRKRMEFERRVKEEQSRETAYQNARQQQQEEGRPRDEEERTVHVDGAVRKAGLDPLGYYKMLGLQGREKSATREEIISAFRKLAKLHHPDVQPTGEGIDAKPGGDPQKMQAIIEAYNVLRDAGLRKEYDLDLLKRTA